MAELLATAAPKGLLMVRDELAGWIAGMNSYHGAGRQFWLDPMAAAPIVWSAKAAPIRCRATTRPVYRVGMPPKTLTANRGTIAAQGWSSDGSAHSENSTPALAARLGEGGLGYLADARRGRLPLRFSRPKFLASSDRRAA
jgi:hypothetical protein